jgi:autotransporter-associated beta strand protein
MKSIPCKHWKAAIVALAASAIAFAVQAQTVTNPNPNRVISWNLDDYSTVNPTDLAGLAAATNWVDTYLNNITIGLPDNTGAATTMNLSYGSYNTYQVEGSHPGYDANGTANREMLNGFLNAGPAAWNPPTTNTYVSLTNVPYPLYDVVVYFNSDTSGRNSTISDGTTTYSFSTVGTPSISGANASFIPTTQTNNSVFPNADFAFFQGETNANVIFTTYPKSGNDQWLGIAAFQVIQASNVYVLYGPSPASQIVPVGQPASFSVMAGGLTPSYQWRHAGTNLLNATNATYAIASTAPGQDGNYDVIVSNGYGSVTSVVATLTFYTPKTVEWDGNGATWDTTSLFWTVNGGASTTNYTETDNVRFGTLGSAQPTVSLAGTFSPSSITVSNAIYMLTSGGLAGSGSLHLMNNAGLILDTADTSTGPTLIDSGSTLQLDNGDAAGALGSGALTNNGGLLFNSSSDYAYGYPIYGTGGITNNGANGQITLANTVNAAYLVQAGSGSMLLQGSNSLSGGLVVSGGTALARAANCLGLAPVIVSGGELQLIFNIDFTGSDITLSGGTLHGGVSGSDIYEGTVTLTTDSQINVDTGDSLTLNNASGISASAYNLYVGGGGTLILAGANNTWSSLNITLGTVQIGNGGGGSLGGGTIDDAGTLSFNTAGNLAVTNPIIDGGSINQIGAGTVVFTGNASGFTGTTTVTSGGLGGTTTFGGPVNVLPGATLAPGTPTAIGTLTINNNLTIGGNLLVKINKSLAQSNDLVSVTGTLSNTNNGAVTVNNLGPALVAGNKFTLFSQPVSGGGLLSISGSGAVWSNNLATDGSIIVLSATVPHPVIRTINISGGNVVVSGTNGTASGTCYLLSSTNLATPLANWVRVSTNSFDSNGNFNITNAAGGAPRNFYILQSQ